MNQAQPEELYIKVFDWMAELFTGNTLLVFALVYSLGEVNGQTYIAERTHTPRETVGRIIKKLAAIGVIEIEHSGSRCKPFIFRCNFSRCDELRSNKTTWSDVTKHHNAMCQNITTRCDETSQHVVTKHHNTLCENVTTRCDETSQHFINNINIDRNIDRNTHTNTRGADHSRRSKKPPFYISVLEGLNVSPTPELIDSINGFIEHRKKLKKPMTDNALKLNLNKAHKLAGGDVQGMADLLNLAIERGWQGIYKDREKGGAKNDGAGNEDFFK